MSKMSWFIAGYELPTRLKPIHKSALPSADTGEGASCENSTKRPRHNEPLDEAAGSLMLLMGVPPAGPAGAAGDEARPERDAPDDRSGAEDEGDSGDDHLSATPMMSTGLSAQDNFIRTTSFVRKLYDIFENPDLNPSILSWGKVSQTPKGVRSAGMVRAFPETALAPPCP